MVKIIKDEQGNKYVYKTPIYKKWWFWVIAIFVGLIIIGTFGETEDTSSTANEDKTEDKVANDENKIQTKIKTEYTIGEVAKHNGIEMEVKSVKWLPTNEFSSLKDFQEYCAIELEIKNS